MDNYFTKKQKSYTETLNSNMDNESETNNDQLEDAYFPIMEISQSKLEIITRVDGEYFWSDGKSIVSIGHKQE